MGVSPTFAGTVGVVTGAGGLVGSHVVASLVERGATVVAADLPGAPLDDVAARHGSSVRTVPTDVTEESAVAQLFEVARDVAGGSIDFVFNNAGVEGPIGSVDALDVDALRRMLDVNVVGAASVLKHASRIVGAGASIVQTGSTASLGGAAHLAPYVMSKHAVLGLTRAASRELAPRGIRVNAVLPGPIAGPMMDRIASGRSERATPTGGAAGSLDDGRLATVDEVVAAVIFLLGRESAFVAGSGLVVDGGRSA